jgi:hypothetical protein
MSAQIPNIIVFDIDGTLIGDIEPQIVLYNLHNALKSRNNKVNILQSKYLRESLRNGIIRPYFIKFIKTVKELIPNTEFFIYTASEKKWANFLIGHVEAACGCKFNRPIMSRDNCILFNSEFKKKVDVIYKCIVKTLRKKYNVKSLNSKDLEDKLMIIDNNVVYDKSDMKHVLLCPTYAYKKLENIPLYVTETLFNTYSQLILDVLSRYIPSITLAKDYTSFQRIFYKYYIDELSQLKEPKDKYFLKLSNIIHQKNITSFSPRTLYYITNKLQAGNVNS